LLSVECFFERNIQQSTINVQCTSKEIMKNVAYMNWSGGKDSSLCLHYILQDARYSVDCLLTSVNAAHNRISMHGVRRELLEQQAEAIGLPLQTIELPEQPGMQEYENAMLEKVSQLKQNGYSLAIYSWKT
jgi:diphthamide synthase (EF-2-diphthine--ammonia ligase)